MRCSVFENEEDTPGWKEGKSVAYCETCFNETMKRRESSEGQDDAVGIGVQPVRVETGNIEGERS